MKAGTPHSEEEELLQQASGTDAVGEMPVRLLPEHFSVAIEAHLASECLSIPMLPEIAMHLMTRQLDEESDLRALTEIVYRDQMLAVQILRAANSVAVGGERSVTSIAEAISRLGLQALGEIVIAVTLKSRIFSLPEYDFILKKYWRLSASAAAYAKELGRISRTNAELSFICGLLHNIGYPVTLLAMIDIQNELRLRLPRPLLLRAIPCYAKRVTTLLLRKWELPAPLNEAILEHAECPHRSDLSFETEITCLAALFAEFAQRPRPALEKAIREHAVTAKLRLEGEKLELLFAYRQPALQFAASFL